MVTWLYQQNSLYWALNSSYCHSDAAYMFMYGMKACSHMHVREREICYVHQQWFSLKIKQTHCHCLATTHPAGQTSMLSFIQRHPPLYVSLSLALKDTHTDTYTQPPGRERKGELHHPSIKAVAAARPWKETCRLQERMQILLCDFSGSR